MAKNLALDLKKSLLVGGLGFWGADYLVNRWSGYPFLYCWLSPAATSLYISWGLVFLYCSLAYSVFHLFTRRYHLSFCGVMAFVAIIELPLFADTVLRLGGSCG